LPLGEDCRTGAQRGLLGAGNVLFFHLSDGYMTVFSL
jgi:hypothetical protein